jgi:hypothetical protein
VRGDSVNRSDLKVRQQGTWFLSEGKRSFIVLPRSDLKKMLGSKKKKAEEHTVKMETVVSPVGLMPLN